MTRTSEAVDVRAAERVAITPETPAAEAAAVARAWVREHVPAAWREAASAAAPAPSAQVRTRADYEAWYPVFGRSGLVVPTWPVGVRRPRPVAARGPGRRGRAGALQPRPAQPARAQPGRAGAVRARHRGAAAALPPADRAQRGGVVPALQRAGRRLRPRLARHPGRARRRRVGAHRPEGVDHLGPPRRLRRAASPAPTPTCPSARASPTSWSTCTARRRGAPAAPHRRRGRLQRGVPRRRPGARRPPRRRRGRRLAGGQRHAVGRAPDGVGLGLGRRRPHRRLGRRRASIAAARREQRARHAIAVDAPAARGASTARSGSAAGPTSGCGPGVKAGRLAGPGELDRQGPPGRAQPAHPAARRRPARPGGRRRGSGRRRLRRRRCRTRWRGCCAAGPTRSRAARPR